MKNNWLKKYKKGGDMSSNLWETDKHQWMDSVINANVNNPWVRNLMNPNVKTPYLQETDSYVHPNFIQNYEDFGVPVNTLDQAEYFIENADSYKNMLPPEEVQKRFPKKKNGGKVGKTDNTSYTGNERYAKAQDWLNTPHQTFPTISEAKQTEEGRDERLNKLARQTGFDDYDQMLKAQKIRNNPKWQTASDFAEKVGDIYAGIEGAGFLKNLGKAAYAKMAWGEPAASLGDGAPKGFRSYGLHDDVNIPYRGPFTAPKSSVDLTPRLTGDLEKPPYNKEEDIWNSLFKNKKPPKKEKYGGKITNNNWLQNYK